DMPFHQIAKDNEFGLNPDHFTYENNILTWKIPKTPTWVKEREGEAKKYLQGVLDVTFAKGEGGITPEELKELQIKVEGTGSGTVQLPDNVVILPGYGCQQVIICQPCQPAPRCGLLARVFRRCR